MIEDRDNEGYSAVYDSFFNTETFEWYDADCLDKECEFCFNRPKDARNVENEINTLRLH